MLVPPEDVDALATVLRDEGLRRFDPARAVAKAQRFSVVAFKSQMRRHVASAVADRASN